MTTSPALPLKLAVVGHTNTGKTSLMRTLLRNVAFGEIQNSAGTTRHVEAAQISLRGQSYIELRDTPGLEDSVALSSHIKTLQAQDLRGRACLEHFIQNSPPALLNEFEQEIKVLRQALDCNALLYVIDSREDVLEKYREEILTLKLASRPILPVLNFIQDNSEQLPLWRAELAELGLHALVEFDTVAFDFDAEKRLYQKLQTLLEAWYQPLQTLLDHRAEEWRQTCDACIAQVADLLIEMATLTVSMDSNDAQVTLQNTARQREQQCLNTILTTLKFSPADVQMNNLPVRDGEWELDLFEPETLKRFGLDAASAAATGAAIGAGVDLLLAGLSLGTASLTGAALGTAWHTGRRYGKDLIARLRGDKVLCVDDATLNILLLRQLSLLRHLFRRGHAAQNPFQLNDQTTENQKSDNKIPAGWPEQLRKIRSILNTKASMESREYNAVLSDLKSWLARAV